MSGTFPEAQMIHLRAQVEALVSEREGMIAANRAREACGQAPAYAEHSFQQNADSLRYVIPDPRAFE